MHHLQDGTLLASTIAWAAACRQTVEFLDLVSSLLRKAFIFLQQYHVYHNRRIQKAEQSQWDAHAGERPDHMMCIRIVLNIIAKLQLCTHNESQEG